MNNYGLKDKLRNRELTIGSWISFGFNQTCEIMAKAGFDWLVLDMEHAAIDRLECLNLIQIIESNGVSPLVRVGNNDPFLIKQAMDMGAHGVIVPMVNTVEDACRAIESLYYPPYGKRGVGLSRAQGYGNSFEDYKNWADTNIVLIVQIEHHEGVKNLTSIMSLEKIDGFIVGPYDLSGSLGYPGRWDMPIVKKELDKIHRYMASDNKPGGYHVVHGNHQELLDCINDGYNFIAYGDDMVFFSDKVLGEMKYLKKNIST